MRALRFHSFGNPTDQLRLEELPRPEPRAHEVIIRYTHRPINPSDLLTVSGQYGKLPELPATPGLEGMGVIDALGSEVKGWQIGQRVIPLGGSGTWAELGRVPANRLLPVPDAVPDQSAAQFLGNPVTAWVMLEDLLDLKPGDWILQTAAGSTLGRLVIQLAKIKGYRTVNLVRRPEHMQELLDLGGDAAFCTAEPDIVEQIHALTGKGAHAALEAVGGKTGTLAISSLRPGAKLIAYGMLSGSPTPVNWGELLFRGITIEGYWLYHWFRATDPTHVQTVMMQLMQLMATGELVPPVSAEVDLADYQQAIALATLPGRSGKVLLTG